MFKQNDIESFIIMSFIPCNREKHETINFKCVTEKYHMV
jgi:hypothetical protein